MLFINPPFGNYISLPKTISIKGSFTLEPRSGLISQIFKTMRFSFKYNGSSNLDMTHSIATMNCIKSLIENEK